MLSLRPEATGCGMVSASRGWESWKVERVEKTGPALPSGPDYFHTPLPGRHARSVASRAGDASLAMRARTRVPWYVPECTISRTRACTRVLPWYTAYTCTHATLLHMRAQSFQTAPPRERMAIPCYSSRRCHTRRQYTSEHDSLPARQMSTMGYQPRLCVDRQ